MPNVKWSDSILCKTRGWFVFGLISRYNHSLGANFTCASTNSHKFSQDEVVKDVDIWIRIARVVSSNEADLKTAFASFQFNVQIEVVTSKYSEMLDGDLETFNYDDTCTGVCFDRHLLLNCSTLPKFPRWAKSRITRLKYRYLLSSYQTFVYYSGRIHIH